MPKKKRLVFPPSLLKGSGAAAAAYVSKPSHKNAIPDDELLSAPPTTPLVKCAHNPIRVEFGMIWGCAVFVLSEKWEQDASPIIGEKGFSFPGYRRFQDRSRSSHLFPTSQRLH